MAGLLEKHYGIFVSAVLAVEKMSSTPDREEGWTAVAAKKGLPTTSDFSDPVYKEIALRNGEINKMTKEMLKQKLRDLNLDSRGHKEVLKKRLKSFYKRRKLSRQKKPKETVDNGLVSQYDYLCVIDFEATCQAYNSVTYQHEIIEFPIVLVDTEKLEMVDEFHSFVRPKVHPKLSEFCTQLTGISQATVDRADNFSTVLKRADSWLAAHDLGNNKSFAVVTDGPWDMGRFLRGQCQISGLPFPRWGKRWINVRKTFGNFYDTQRTNLIAMLEALGLTLEGRQHSGLDDARNIARVVICALRDGAELRINEKLNPAVDDLLTDSASGAKLAIPVGKREAQNLFFLEVSDGESEEEEKERGKSEEKQ